MKKYMSFLLLVLFVFSSFGIGMNQADAYVSVKGYYRKNGTYVAPYVRSNPNGLKYDNYGYKPSQGLYNPSYGTRGSTWDTPTYITDPYYYQGKYLYESGISGSSNTYVSPSLPKGSSSGYETVTGGYKSYGILFCDTNYYEVSGKCKKAPKNSTPTYYSFYCNLGYVKDGNNCIKLPDNAVESGDSWKCNLGYTKVADSCKKIENSHIKNDGYAYCNDGYVWNETACYTYTQNCQLTYGRNSYGDKNYCYCSTGYGWNSDKTKCIKL